MWIYLVEKKGNRQYESLLKFIYSEKATKFCEIFPLLLTAVLTVKSKGNISQNFETFSEYMNFNLSDHNWFVSNERGEENESTNLVS
jgi:hypothetical protein